LKDPASSSNTSSVPPGGQSNNTRMVLFPGDATRKHQLMPVSQECLSYVPSGVYCMHFDERDTLAVQKAAVSFWKRSMTGDIQSHLLGTESSWFLFSQFVRLQHISAEEDGTLSWPYTVNMPIDACIYLTKLNP
jgi:hypothetical protein